MRLKRILSLLLAVLTIFSLFVVCFEASAKDSQLKNQLRITESYKPKAINIVYDDSGSMVNGQSNKPHKGLIDRWAQAKYSLEIFVSILDDEDVLNVFTMSDAGNKVRYSIQGRDRANAVKNIHVHFKTGDYPVVTPINTLDAAYKNLSKVNADRYDRWLVVITDGAFTGPDKKPLKDKKAAEKRMQKYANNLNKHLIYIPIDVEDDYNYHNAAFTTYDKGSIRDRLLLASDQIYTQRDKVDSFNVKAGVIETDGISLSKIFVFLQGDNVKLNGITSDIEGEKFESTQIITVKYTEAKDAVQYIPGAAKNRTFKGVNIKTNPKLNGVVAIIEPKEENSFIKSKSKITLQYGEKAQISSGAVYYVPAVAMQYSLKDQNGKEWVSSESSNKVGTSISPGDYTLTADIIDAGTQKGNLNNNRKLAPIAMEVTILGQNYSLEELQKGVNIHFESDDDLSETTAVASVKDGKYAVDTSDFLNAFANCTIKPTYTLKVSFEKEKNHLDFGFKKVEYLSGQLKKIKGKKDMIKATVTCYDESGEKVALTDEVWAKVADAANNGGVSADNTAIYVGNVQDDKKTKVDYDLFVENSVTADGTGVIYVQPKCILDKKGKPDRVHTTHRNLWFWTWKYTCPMIAEINIPNASDTLAYSTTPANANEKSYTYVISIGIWATIILILLGILAFLYAIKKRLPRNKKKIMVNKSRCKRETDLQGNVIWPSRGPLEADKSIKLEVSKFTRFCPIIAQRGTLTIDNGGLVLDLKAHDRSRRNVELKTPPESFKRYKSGRMRGEWHFQIGADDITEQFLIDDKEENGAYVFDFTVETIYYGRKSGSIYREYEIKKDK